MWANILQLKYQMRAIFFAGMSMAPNAAHDAIARATTTSMFIMPVTPACISSPFGPRVLPNRPLAGTFHSGIDLPAPVGAPVAAVAPGAVIRIQRHGVGGLELLVQHDGFIGVYSHLGTISPIIAEGRKSVFGGERLATVGRTGLTYGPHLYFGMIVGEHSVDPAPYLAVKSCGANVQTGPELPIRPTRLFTHR